MCFSELWVSSLEAIQLGLNEAGSGPGTKPCQSLLCDLWQISQLL